MLFHAFIYPPTALTFINSNPVPALFTTGISPATIGVGKRVSNCLIGVITELAAETVFCSAVFTACWAVKILAYMLATSNWICSSLAS